MKAHDTTLLAKGIHHFGAAGIFCHVTSCQSSAELSPREFLKFTLKTQFGIKGRLKRIQNLVKFRRT